MASTSLRWRAALAVGLAAITPAPLSAQAPGPRSAVAAEPPVAVSVGKQEDFTRLTFAWAQGATSVQASRSGTLLELRFSRAGDPRLAELRISPPPGLRNIRRVSSPGEPLVLQLDLQPTVGHRAFAEDGRVVVDLLTPKTQTSAEKKTAEASTGDPGPTTGVVPVKVVEESQQVRISVRWTRPARAAAFRRGEAFYILFDSKALLDVANVPRANRFYRDLAQVHGEGVVGLRLSTSPEMQISAESEGPEWTFLIGESADHEGASAKINDLGQERVRAGQSKLTADFGRAGVVRWIEDPEIGDRFAAALLEGPVIGVDGRRISLEAALLPAAQGAVVEARADGVGARFDGGVLIVTRGGGLVTSGPSEAPLEVVDPPLLRPIGSGDARATLAALTKEAAVELGQSNAEPRSHLLLAQQLLSLELAPEALGILRSALKVQPEMVNDKNFRLMRGAANAMLNRLSEARSDLEFGGLAQDPTACLWRGYVASKAHIWSEARRNLELGRDALFGQPQAWRQRMRLALAESALELGDFVAADAALAEAMGEIEGGELKDSARFLQARLAGARGELEAALAIYDELAKSRLNEQVAVASALEALKTRRILGQVEPDAVERLELLRFRWRGDDLETDIITALGHAYADQGKWRDALTVLHANAARFPNTRAGRSTRQDLAALFEELFLEGRADDLPPVQALALFYEFKDLTPVGARGDLMVRRLAKRLVALDLLEQAAALLQYQVDNRLRGIMKSQIAVDLAAIYLSDSKPEKALDVIESTRLPNLPADLIAQRRLMEATILVRLERYDHAEELIERDTGPDIARLRGEIYWRRRQWPLAVASLQEVLPPTGQAALDDESRRIVLRLGVAAVFAEDDAATARLRRDYLKAMQASPDADAFDVLTLTPSVADIRLRNVVAEVGKVDLLQRFLDRLNKSPAPAPAQPGARTPEKTAQSNSGSKVKPA